MKLPDIGQPPREYHDNLKSVVLFIENSLKEIKSISDSLSEIGDSEVKADFDSLLSAVLEKQEKNAKQIASAHSKISDLHEALLVASDKLDNLSKTGFITHESMADSLSDYSTKEFTKKLIDSTRRSIVENVDTEIKSIQQKCDKIHKTK